MAEHRHPAMPYAFGIPPARARLRVAAEDFRVDELGVVTPSGEGEHLLLRLRKRERNTAEVARLLAQVAGVAPGAVSYAGLKDRIAVTSQWFSVHLPGRADPELQPLLDAGLEVLEAGRHSRKLRRGALRGNRFLIRLREVQGEREAVEARLARIRADGVPNYFGEQRFGRGGGNLERAEAMFARRFRPKDRNLRGLYLSAARSLLFNLVLAERVRAGHWDRLLQGEAAMLEGSDKHFLAESVDATLEQRLAAHDIHPSGPLWGRGRPICSGEALAFEEAVLEPYALWRDGLEHAGLSQERRSTRLLARELSWRWETPTLLELGFVLPPGCYATTLLRELADCGGEED